MAGRGYDQYWAPVRCGARFSAIEDALSEKILFGEQARPDRGGRRRGTGEDAAFTFTGEDKTEIADVPPIVAEGEAAAL